MVVVEHKRAKERLAFLVGVGVADDDVIGGISEGVICGISEGVIGG